MNRCRLISFAEVKKYCSALLVLPELKLKNELPSIVFPSAPLAQNPLLSRRFFFAFLVQKTFENKCLKFAKRRLAIY
jgi:hypothetical protein